MGIDDMKIFKPKYNAEEKVYVCELGGAKPRFAIVYDLERPMPSRDPAEIAKDTYTNSLKHYLLKETKGWFTKPLTDDWLSMRIYHDIPVVEIPAEWEGTLELTIKELVITKEKFTFIWIIDKRQEKEKVVIQLEEEDQEQDQDQQEVDEEALPMAAVDPMSIGPTRRILQKHAVMKARARAARALFKAESITHEYVRQYGEDTDWEDDDGSSVD
jgi:hypothetical protein